MIDIDLSFSAFDLSLVSSQVGKDADHGFTQAFNEGACLLKGINWFNGEVKMDTGGPGDLRKGSQFQVIKQ